MLARFAGQVKGLRARPAAAPRVSGLPGRCGLPSHAWRSRPPSIFVAGEVSGDTHGAALLTALRRPAAGTRFPRPGRPAHAGRGRRRTGGLDRPGGRRRAVGSAQEIRVLPAQFDRVLAEIVRCSQPPWCSSTIPASTCGWRSRCAAAGRPSLKIIYYISPQVWAWNRGRIPRMARLLDLMICIFPFEPALYEPAGLRSVFVGHPLIDALAAERADAPVRGPGARGSVPGQPPA